MINWTKQWDCFVEEFVTRKGYLNVLNGLLVTIEIAIIGLIIGIIIGTLIASIKVVPKRNFFAKALEKIGDVYVAFFRGTPIIVQLLVVYWVLFPLLSIAADGLIVAFVVFGLNSGAYVSEIMRSGIQSVDIGQMEAGRAIGLSYAKTMIKIVIPQAIKNILPTLGNEFISLIKETSVVYIIVVEDLCKAFQKLGAPSSSYVIPYLMMAVIYIILVVLITFGIRLIERRLKKNER